MTPVDQTLYITRLIRRKDARPLREETIISMMPSLQEVGQINPVPVRKLLGREGYEVLGGGHRIEALTRLGRPTIRATVFDLNDIQAELMVLADNYERTELSPAERAATAARYKELHTRDHGDPKARGAEAANAAMGRDAPAKLAKAFEEEQASATGKSARAIRRDVQRGESIGHDALKKIQGTSLDKGEELDALVKMTPEGRAAVIEKAAGGVRVSAKVEVKKELRNAREEKHGKRQRALPEKRYGLILEDYEWDDEVYSRETGMDRHAANHYETSEAAHTPEEIAARRPVQNIADPKCCIIYAWTTNQHLEIALKVMELRGFSYKSNHVWAKDKISTGRWNRSKHEILLIGTMGDAPCPAPGTQWDSLIPAPVGPHSAKPECFIEMLEELYPTLTKIELNRRGPARPGWDAWGNEAEEPEAADTETQEA